MIQLKPTNEQQEALQWSLANEVRKETLGRGWEGSAPRFPHPKSLIASLFARTSLHYTMVHSSSERTEEKRIHDVIVIGAGVAGLHCASLLQKQNIDVLVLEAADYIGYVPKFVIRELFRNPISNPQRSSQAARRVCTLEEC